jgi:hypothetical protein
VPSAAASRRSTGGQVFVRAVRVRKRRSYILASASPTSTLNAAAQVLDVTADLRRALLPGADETQVADLARQHGYVPLREGGLAQAGRGETTYEEVLRVTRATI